MVKGADLKQRLCLLDCGELPSACGISVGHQGGTENTGNKNAAGQAIKAGWGAQRWQGQEKITLVPPSRQFGLRGGGLFSLICFCGREREEALKGIALALIS